MGAIGLYGNQQLLVLGPRGLISTGPLDNLVFDRYVDSGGVASGPGSIGAPWSLAYAAGGAGGSIASDVARASPNNHCYIAVRGGTYHITSQLNFTTTGTLGTGVDSIDGKVVFRNYPGERWIITAGDGAAPSYDAVRTGADYCWVCYAELSWSTWTDRSANATGKVGYYMSVPGSNPTGGTKIIHCVARDLRNGFTANEDGAPTVDNEYYGNIAFCNGSDETAPGGNGHGFYVRHDPTGAGYLNVRCNISFDQFGLDFQIYNASTGLNHMRFEDNIGFNGGMRATAGGTGEEVVCYPQNSLPIHEMSLVRNRFYKASTDGGPCFSKVGIAGQTGDNIELSDNYCVSSGGGQTYEIRQNITTQNTMSMLRNFGRTSDTLVSVSQAGTLGYVWRQNDWHRPGGTGGGFSPGTSWASFKSTTSLGTETNFLDTNVATDPVVTQVFVVAANKYEGGRANICYYDWANQAGALGYIPADVSAILAIGDPYVLYDVRNLASGVQTGVYNGVPLHLPITQLVPTTAIGTSNTGLTPPQTAPFFNAFVLRKS